MSNLRLGIITLASICLFSCEQKPQESMQLSYNEKFRPQYHYTPPSQWMNDPNGMVYHEGEYHLFYQYYPDSTVWGPMHWGHAVSRDMVSWEQLPVALYPDSLGYIFSGSVVVDTRNTSGFGTDSHAPMVAIFTYHNERRAMEGLDDFQSQGIAYSLDRGRSWTKYEGNPVLPNQGVRDFRDPKVSWNEQSTLWIMTLAVADHISFYSSPDLKTWTFESDFGKNLGAHGGVWECPDLFPLKVEGTATEKWVLLVSINPGGSNGGSATQYFVGQFDGHTFSTDQPTEETKWLDYGTDNYAGVTWSNIPDQDGRRLFLGWMSNWQYAQLVPTQVWRSAMTLPRELKLQELGGEMILTSFPVEEMQKIVGEPMEVSPVNGKAIPLSSPLAALNIELENGTFSGIQLLFSNGAGEELSISLSDSLAYIDRSKSGMTDFEKGFGVTHEGKLPAGSIPRTVKVFLDASSVEIFVNQGELAMTDLIFPTQPYTQLTISWTGDKVIRKVQISEVRRIW